MRRCIYGYMLEQKLIFEHEQAVRIQSSIPPCESKSRIPPYILYRRKRTHLHTLTHTYNHTISYNLIQSHTISYNLIQS